MNPFTKEQMRQVGDIGLLTIAAFLLSIALYQAVTFTPE